MFDDFTDEMLMERYATTLDEGAFSALVARYQSSALAIAHGRVGNIDIAKDVVEECFLRIVRFREKFDKSRSFKSWLFTILRNICIDMKRKGGRERLKLDEYAEHLLVRSEERPKRSLNSFLELLKQEEKELLVLRFFHGMKFSELALFYHCSEEAVKKRVQRVLLKLKNHNHEKF